MGAVCLTGKREKRYIRRATARAWGSAISSGEFSAKSNAYFGWPPGF